MDFNFLFNFNHSRLLIELILISKFDANSEILQRLDMQLERHLHLALNQLQGLNPEQARIIWENLQWR